MDHWRNSQMHWDIRNRRRAKYTSRLLEISFQARNNCMPLFHCGASVHLPCSQVVTSSRNFEVSYYIEFLIRKVRRDCRLVCLNAPICLRSRYRRHDKLQRPLGGGTAPVGNRWSNWMNRSSWCVFSASVNDHKPRSLVFLKTDPVSARE